jgi:hypothetical protein
MKNTGENIVASVHQKLINLSKKKAKIQIWFLYSMQLSVSCIVCHVQSNPANLF